MAYFGYSDSMSGSSHHGQGVQYVPFKTSTVSLRVLLLHGDLDIWVKEAKNLPNMDLLHKNLGDMFGRLSVKFMSKVEGTTSSKITSDPYVTIAVSDAVIGRTFVISNDENPVWGQHFHVPVAHHGAEVHFVVKDSDVVGSQIIGAVGIPVEQLLPGAAGCKREAMQPRGCFEPLNSVHSNGEGEGAPVSWWCAGYLLPCPERWEGDSVSRSSRA